MRLALCAATRRNDSRVTDKTIL